MLEVQSGVARPSDPFQGGKFDFFDGPLWLAGFDLLGF